MRWVMTWGLHGSDFFDQHIPEIWGIWIDGLRSTTTNLTSPQTRCCAPQTIPEPFLLCSMAHHPVERSHSHHQGIPFPRKGVHGLQQCLGRWYVSVLNPAVQVIWAINNWHDFKAFAEDFFTNSCESLVFFLYICCKVTEGFAAVKSRWVVQKVDWIEEENKERSWNKRDFCWKLEKSKNKQLLLMFV